MSRGVALHDDNFEQEQGSMLPNPHDREDLELQRFVSTEQDLHYKSATYKPGFEGVIGRAKTLRKKQRDTWNRFNGAGRRKIGLLESLRNIATSSILNVLFLAIPLAWVAHFLQWSHRLTFALCFISMVPLEKMFEWCGEQLALYCGKDVGDLIIITLNNVVEATLTIILLVKCELKLVQSTVVGVVLLHLLLVPGMAFLTGGSEIWEQQLHPHTTQLNQSLLILGVMTLVIPTAYFAALDRGFTVTEAGAQILVNDKIRGEFLHMSRGTAFFLLLIYLFSRIYLHNPPGEGRRTTSSHPDAPDALKHEEIMLETQEPEVNPWICVITTLVTVALVAVTAQFLVESVEPLRIAGHIGDEWFGLILLPVVSFGADAAVAVIYFVRKLFKNILGTAIPDRPSELAKARAIDLSIQFTLFWFPLFILIAWWTRKPLSLLLDMYEVAVLLAASFMVNYITQDSKTNWVEGAIMVVFYFLIVMWTWFYPGQEEVKMMLACKGDVAEAIISLVNGGGGE